MSFFVKGSRMDGFRLGHGGECELKLGPYGEMLVNDIGLGRYFDAVRRGIVFTTISKSVTIAATHNSPIAANTATPVVGFLNTSTNKAAVLLKAFIASVSGTPAGGQAVINVQAGQTTITAAATGTINNNLVSGGTSGGSQMRPLNNVALAGWLATPNAVQEVCFIGGAAAAAVASQLVLPSDMDGLIIVPPNALCALMAGNGAGTSWIVNAGLTWAEIDWPL